MNWELKIANRAAKAIRKAPQKDRLQIIATLDQMPSDPLDGDCKKLRGYAPSLFRRRIGNWRVIFGLDFENKTISILDILRRTTKTYKR